MNLGNIVTTRGDETHKRIFSIAGKIFALEFYSYGEGRTSEYVNEDKLTFVSEKPTEEFLKLKTICENRPVSKKVYR